jgi:endoglycosylceramidase
VSRGAERHRRATGVVVTLAVALVAGACAPGPVTPPPVLDPGTSTELTHLRAVGGSSAAIVDAAGREVQLRGVNLNHLGDYFSSDPRLPTVSDLGEDDWEDLAALGFNVVRLVTNWSAWEPERDVYDPAYAERVRDTVAEANAHGLWVVIDMHQDAWSKYVFTPRGTSCLPGTRPQIGWDGAPAWATFTDGLDTCTPAGREDSPAVKRAWDAFWVDREGIRTELAELWGHIATEFAGDAGIAGFDLLNEPGFGFVADTTISGLTQFYVDALHEIRAAERAVGSDPHLVFFETTVLGPWVPKFSDDPDLVFAPHIYLESIGPKLPGLLDAGIDGLRLLGSVLYGTPVWIGEYGAFSDAASERTWMDRFARLHDAAGFSGGAWWQWEQECGDPHDVNGAWPPDEDWIEGQLGGCDGSRMPKSCPTRSYPRAAPGVERIVAAPCGGRLDVEGNAFARSTADLWLAPAPGTTGPPSPAPQITGSGIGDVTVRPEAGGWRVFVEVAGRYSIRAS